MSSMLPEFIQAPYRLNEGFTVSPDGECLKKGADPMNPEEEED